VEKVLLTASIIDKAILYGRGDGKANLTFDGPSAMDVFLLTLEH